MSADCGQAGELLVAPHVVGADDDGGPVGQAPQRSGRTSRRRTRRRACGRRGQSPARADVRDVVGEPTVLHGDALRPARGSGGEDHVGEARRRERRPERRRPRRRRVGSASTSTSVSPGRAPRGARDDASTIATCADALDDGLHAIVRRSDPPARRRRWPSRPREGDGRAAPRERHEHTRLGGEPAPRDGRGRRARELSVGQPTRPERAPRRRGRAAASSTRSARSVRSEVGGARRRWRATRFFVGELGRFATASGAATTCAEHGPDKARGASPPAARARSARRTRGPAATPERRRRAARAGATRRADGAERARDPRARRAPRHAGAPTKRGVRSGHRRSRPSATSERVGRRREAPRWRGWAGRRRPVARGLTARDLVEHA